MIARPSPVRTALFFGGAAVVAWAIAFARMRGMDAGPGTDLGGLGWFLGLWVTMTAAMMLPSAAPAARSFPTAATSFFAAGYLAAWTAYGLAAYGLFRLVSSFDIAWLAWDEAGPLVAGGVIAAAGLYELTPPKRRFLRRCRSTRHPDGGALGAGLENGVYCLGCCWTLMAVLFALGVMSLFWMAVVAGIVFVEKVLPNGVRLGRAVGPALVALGIWVAVSPATVPGLTHPHHKPAHMEV